MPMNTKEFRQHGKELVDYICDYVETIGKRRVISNVEPGYLAPLLNKSAPVKGEPWDEILQDVEDKIMPGITHWNHPSFHAYFPAGNSYPSILGDMLSSAIGCIGFSWAASPACTELETIVLDWLGKAINLPPQFIHSTPGSRGGGVIEGSASECILVSMLAARKQAMLWLKFHDKSLRDLEDAMLLPNLVAYTSKEAHSSVEKAALIALVKLRILDTDDNCSMTGEILAKAIKEDVRKGLHPFFVSATLGSTGCTAFDKLEEIGAITKDLPACWLHVDGAYAGGGFVCPELQPLMKGIEHADSFNTNPNKWLLVNFDCSCLWVRDSSKLTQALVVDPLYLHHAHDKETVDYRHWCIPLSRRFRSLKLWFTLRNYGIEGLQEYIRNHCRLAKEFEKLVNKDPRFEVANQVRLGLVCFRVKAPDDMFVKAGVNDRLNQSLLASINASGKLHMIPSLVNGNYILRFCVVHEHATIEHIESAWKTIKEHATQALDRLQKEFAKPPTPVLEVPLPPPPSARILTRRMSFTRSVSREMYETRCSRNSLYDGATPIIVPEDDGLDLPDLAEVEDVFESSFKLEVAEGKLHPVNGVHQNGTQNGHHNGHQNGNDEGHEDSELQN